MSSYVTSKTVRLLLLSEMVWSFGIGLFFPIFAIFSERVGGQIIHAGIAAAIFIFVASLFEYPIRVYIGNFHEKWLIVASYLLEALIFVGYIFVSHINELFVLQVFLGIASAIGKPAWKSLYRRSVPQHASSEIWEMSHMVIGITKAASILIGVYIITQHSFDVVFGLAAILSFLAAIIAAIFIKNSPRR